MSSVTRDKSTVQSADIITNKRSLESTVLVDDGQIVVLGGLIQDDQQAAIDKVPLLGDIPFLGTSSGTRRATASSTNLMVFLRPVVLRDEQAAARAHRRPLRVHPQPPGQHAACPPNVAAAARSAPQQLPPLDGAHRRRR